MYQLHRKNLHQCIFHLVQVLYNGYVTQFINSMGIADKDIPEQVKNIVNSCIQQCRTKGHINIFGLQFEESAFNNFNQIFTNMINNTNMNNNQ